MKLWGYHSDGSAEIFDLKEGETLPDGWADRPEPWHHPNTAHLYKRPESEPPWDEAAPEPQESEAPPAPKPRRGRPRKSEVIE